MTDKNKKEENKIVKEIVLSPPDKRVPKVCTSISFSTNETKEAIILTLTYEEKPTFEERVVIERVIINRELGGKIIEVLQDILKDTTK